MIFDRSFTFPVLSIIASYYILQEVRMFGFWIHNNVILFQNDAVLEMLVLSVLIKMLKSNEVTLYNQWGKRFSRIDVRNEMNVL